MQATTIAKQAPDAPGTAVITIPGVATMQGVPMTAVDVSGLRAKRAELSNQLESAAGRRQRLSSQLVGKEGADRAGLEARIGVLDKRIMQLESDIAETGRQLTMVPPALIASTEPGNQFGGIDPDLVGALSGAFIVFVLAPIAFAAAWRIWKRPNRAAPPPFPAEAVNRLERLEQGMDAIAIEIERVSEGQRFVTRLLSEAQPAPSPGAGQRMGEAVAIAAGSGESGRRAGA